MTWEIPLLVGALVGSGVFLLIRESIPNTTPDLASALRRLNGEEPSPILHEETSSSWFSFLGLRARRRFGESIPGKIVSDSDMAICAKQPHILLGEKIALTIFFTMLAPLMWALLNVVNVHLTIAIPLIVSFAAGAIGWFVPDLLVSSQAKELRAEFSAASSIYLDLLSIARISGAMPIAAMRESASVARSWPFQRIDQAVRSADYTGKKPWDSLQDLREEVGVASLADVADIMRLSGESGASVYEALRGRAKSLRNAQLSAEHARENEVTERMTLPMTIPTLIVLAMLIYPSLMKLIGG